MQQAARAAVKRLAPHFEATAYWKDFTKVSLNDYKGKYLCLFFYPLDFTFVCPTEIIEFNKKAKEFEAAQCQLIGCSVDSEFSHMEWSKKPREQGGLGELNFPLLADITKKVSRDYGVLVEEDGVALRGTFIIDDKQIIRHASINDLSVGRNVDEIIRLIKGYQYADKHGEVCPSNWKEGGATMKADPNAKITLDYWKKVHAK